MAGIGIGTSAQENRIDLGLDTYYKNKELASLGNASTYENALSDRIRCSKFANETMAIIDVDYSFTAPSGGGWTLVGNVGKRYFPYRDQRSVISNRYYNGPYLDGSSVVLRVSPNGAVQIYTDAAIAGKTITASGSIVYRVDTEG